MAELRFGGYPRADGAGPRLRATFPRTRPCPTLQQAFRTDLSNLKIMWILVIALTHLIGALIHYFVRRPQRMQLHGA